MRRRGNGLDNHPDRTKLGGTAIPVVCSAVAPPVGTPPFDSSHALSRCRPELHAVPRSIGCTVRTGPHHPSRGTCGRSR
jgi:hypothetical protein